MRAYEKAAVGALGGLALVLLKLIEVKFLIHEPRPLPTMSSGSTLKAINGPQKDVAASVLKGQVVKGSALAAMK